MPAPAVYILAVVGTIAAGIAFKEVRALLGVSRAVSHSILRSVCL